MFRPALFIIAEKWKQSRCSSAGECINHLWYTSIQRNLLGNKRIHVLIHVATWMNLKSIMLSERSFMQKSTYYMIKFMRFQDKQNYSKKIKTVVAFDEMGRNRLERDMRELSGMLVMFYIVTGAWVTQVYVFVKTHPLDFNM